MRVAPTRGRLTHGVRQYPQERGEPSQYPSGNRQAAGRMSIEPPWWGGGTPLWYGLVGRIPHDFRRTAIRNLERSGVDRPTAKSLVGHKTDVTYERYAIVDEGMQKDAISKLDALHQADREAPKRVVSWEKK